MTTRTALPDAPGFLDIDHLYGSDKAAEGDYVKIKLHDENRTPIAEFHTNAAHFLAAVFNSSKMPGKVRMWQTVEPVPAEPPRRAVTGMTEFEEAVSLLRDAVRALDYRRDRKTIRTSIGEFLAYLGEQEEGAA